MKMKLNKMQGLRKRSQNEKKNEHLSKFDLEKNKNNFNSNNFSLLFKF